jgi:hypothetical protein
MIKILRNEDNSIFYRCGCGVEGRCMVKPMADEGTFLVDVRCPLCGDVERVKLVQYTDVSSRESILGEKKFSWACVITNEITKYFIAKEK